MLSLRGSKYILANINSVCNISIQSQSIDIFGFKMVEIHIFTFFFLS